MIYMLERACAAQVATLSCGREVILPPHEVCEHTAEQFRGAGERRALFLDVGVGAAHDRRRPAGLPKLIASSFTKVGPRSP